MPHWLIVALRLTDARGLIVALGLTDAPLQGDSGGDLTMVNGGPRVSILL